MDWQNAKALMEMMTGPTGAIIVLVCVAVLLVAFLYFQHKGQQSHRKEIREDTQKLHDQHASTIKDLTSAFERTNERIVTAAETAEKLCEARFTALLQEFMRNKP